MADSEPVYEKSKHNRRVGKQQRLMVGNINPDAFGLGTSVAIYVRVSSEEQVEGFSIDAQKEKCLAKAASNEWVVYKIYEDPGFSAKDDHRPAFQQMMSDARRGLFKSIIVHKLDRLMRNVELTARYFKELSEMDVMLTSESEKFDFSSSSGRLYFNMMAVFAQWYLENLSAEVIKAKELMFKRGIHNGRVPFGYDKKDKKAVPHIVVEESKAVIKAFELYATGEYTDRMIADFLNENSVTRRGRTWSKDTVRDLLQNEFYIGMVRHYDDLNDGLQKPIITRALYDRCLEVRKKHAGQAKKNSAPINRKDAYMLQRVIRCAACGRALRIQSSGKYRYYKEVSSERGLGCTMAAKSIKMEDAHEQVLQILGSIQLPAEWQGEIRRMTEDLDYLQQMQNRKAAIDETLRRLARAMVDGGIPEEEYERKRANLMAEKKSLVVPEYSVVMQQGMILDNFSDYLVEATKEELTKIVHLMLNRVDVDFDLAKISKIEVHPEFIELFRMGLKDSRWGEKDPGVFEYALS